MFKKLIFLVFLLSIFLVSCSEGEKTITLNEDTYVEELKNSSKITSEEIEMDLKEVFRFEPGFFYDDKIYGILFSEVAIESKEDNLKENDFTIESARVENIYSAYYSKDENLVKLKKIDESEAFSNMNFKNRRIYDWKNETLKDVVTNEEKKVPEVKIDFTSDTEGIRVQVPIADNNDKVNNNYAKDYIDRKYYGDELSMKEDQYYLVVDSDNYFYRQITNFIYEKNEEDGSSYRNMYGKRDLSQFKSVESMMVLYDYENNKAIIFDGKFIGDFPILSKVMYCENNNKLYAIGGSGEDEVYEININGDSYSLEFIYTFDLGKRLTNVWSSKIIDNSLLIGSFKPVNSEEEYDMKEYETLLLDLNSKEVEVIHEKNENNFIIESNSNKYIIFCTYKEGDKKSRAFLGRVSDNKVQYVYEFEDVPINVVFDEEDKKMIVMYGVWKDDILFSYRYVLYNLDMQ